MGRHPIDRDPSPGVTRTPWLRPREGWLHFSRNDSATLPCPGGRGLRRCRHTAVLTAEMADCLWDAVARADPTGDDITATPAAAIKQRNTWCHPPDL